MVTVKDILGRLRSEGWRPVKQGGQRDWFEYRHPLARSRVIIFGGLDDPLPAGLLQRWWG
jgi:predicted RNA binding protein YcfA (HicA-like mRNA interferase family)